MLNLIKKLFKRQPKKKHRGICFDLKESKDKLSIYDPILRACSMVIEMDCMIRNHNISPQMLNNVYVESGVAYEFADGHLSSVVVESASPTSPLFDYEVKSR